MIPTKNSAHETQGLNHLIDQFRAMPVATGILASWLRGAQRFEDVLFQVLAGRDLATAIGVQLDSLGALVGEFRSGRVDAEYRAAIALRVIINRSQGLAEDVLYLLRTLGTGGQYSYTEYAPARFRVYSFSSGNLDRPLVNAIRQVKPAGVAFDFLGNSGGLLQHEIVYDHTVPSITAYANGGFAHSSGTAADNTPVHVVSF